jgi:hypothetical protein
MSGSMLAEWATSNRPIFSVEKFALEVGCRKLEDSAKLKKCLKDKSVHELLDAMERVVGGGFGILNNLFCHSILSRVHAPMT